jgi:DNA invertase Pin-like site-specific DNA recombinase
MKAVAYFRVSTLGQAVDGVSLEMQRAKVRAWAALNDAEIVAEYADEGLSGKRADRPGLVSAVSAAKREKAALVVYSLSRLSRSTLDTLQLTGDLERAGCDLVSLSEKLDTSTPAGRVVFRVLAALSEFEREQLGERTRAAILHLKAKRQRYGSIPHGFRDEGGQLVNDEREQEVVRQVKSLRARGLSLRKISDELTARGAFNRAGRPFNHNSIGSILRLAA